MYKPSIGDVVLDNNIPMVVVALESNEMLEVVLMIENIFFAKNLI